jgi:phosphopantothenoylcysteine decarboxylase/phosphopantothenate--cysteine ligase
MSGSNLLCIFTGSIAGYKACEALSRLVQRGHRVRCVATPAALNFIGPATLEGLTGSPPLHDLFEPGRALDHINLTRWADAVIVCPGSANTINRLAAGLADDLPGALFLAHDRRKPWLIAPAMNPAMWAHPATTAAVEKLKSWGVRFIPVGEGRTACGEIGAGRLAEPDTLVAFIEAALAPVPHHRLRVLVTAGGTAEPVDGVRVLTNTSTGATGAGIASQIALAGHDVLLLRARNAVPANALCREEIFVTFAQLETALGRILGREQFDAVIHAAAVSDYGVESIVGSDGVVPAGSDRKIVSGSAPLLRLQANPKLVDGLRRLSPGPLTVVAFKLTQGAQPSEIGAAVRQLFLHSKADYVVHNDLAARQPDGGFPADIHGPDGSVLAHCPDRATLAACLEQLLAVGADNN